MLQSKWPLRALIFGAMLFVASLCFLAPELQARVATHFNGAGQPDGWMTRGQHLLFISLLGFGLPAFITGLSYCIRFLPSSMLNTPHSTFWRSPENYPVACRIILHWSYAVGALTLLWMTLLNYQLVAANRLSPPFISPTQALFTAGFYVMGLVLLILQLVRTFYKTR